MSGSPDPTFVMLGLSGTGKTNFLVALDVVLDDQTDPDGLMHSDLAADRAYLQPLKEQWLKGEQFLKTSRQERPTPHQLLVRHPASDARAGLYLPDLAGETFDSQFVTRSFPIDYCNRLEQAGGLLLFLHCDHNADHALLQHQAFVDPAPADQTPSHSRPADWRLEDAAHQVKLVELLQFIAEVRSGLGPLRVALMISAWDLVEKAPSVPDIPKDPARFFSKGWPLLDQFVASHPELFLVRVFGVSARGGGNTPAEVDRLSAFDRPSERVLIVDGAHRSNDLTRPIRWLLDLHDSVKSSDG
jgi:hypothetical protein